MRAVVLLCLPLLCAAGGARADPNALWNIVDGECVPDQVEHADPAPCAEVDLGRGYAVLKDRRGATQFLLIPTARVGGIESAAVLAAGATNYFADAWASRRFVEERAGHALPREDLSLAINSIYGRTQNQFHIHIDCVRQDVRDALIEGQAAIGTTWAPFATKLAGETYLARKAGGENLTVDPFSVLADEVPGAREAMGSYTIVVVGMEFADGTPGFVLLADRADPATGNRGSGEWLQDHDCAVAREPK